ncbi:uncharacterized protein LOC117572280 [Drosophila albomicans]|uniref:Uncharacterized protein LOC117572280 n=1 Tax=Drosophila albomicans TaxID=7291 RepID=A0A6P8XES0_DROAB|nr:uncharacterized protein LOC117572280 [Drosophila albomicans]
MQSDLHSLVTLFLLFATFNIFHAKTIKKAEANLLRPLEELNPWQGKSFPYGPGEDSHNDKKVQRVQSPSNDISKSKDSWQGKWFPYAPGEPHIPITEKTDLQPDPTKKTSTSTKSRSNIKDSWQGKWFPHAPGEVVADSTVKPAAHKPIAVCDDGVNNLAVDFDPLDVRQNYNYLCLQSNRSHFNPNLNTEALLTKHFLPSAYVPPAKCLNESIGYSHEPPTNGAFRPLPAVYGTYKFLPPQRYMRNLAEGAIIMMYHPCAYHGQVEQLQHIVRGCLYRHLITPSQDLTPERPLALLSWSTSLSMSVVDSKQVGQFIRKYAKYGPLGMSNLSRVVEKRDSYKAALLTEAHLVTDLDDSELCGYLEEHM